MDWWGVLTLTACLIPLLRALTWVTNYGWSSERGMSLRAAAVIMLAAFLVVERRAVEPLLPFTLFHDSIITVSTVASFLLGVGMFGVILYVPLFMQGVLGISATRSGSLLTPLMMAAVVSSVTAGSIIGRTGRYRRLAIAGSILTTVGMFLMAAMDHSTTQVELARTMIIARFRVGLVQPTSPPWVANVAPP